VSGRLALLLLGLAPSIALADSEWRMFRATPAGTAALRLAGPGETPRPWQYQAGSHVWGYQPGLSIWSSAALGTVGGRPLVLVGSYDANIYAIDALTGERRWRYTTGGGVYATPAIASVQGRPVVFAASTDRLLYALDADSGRRLWIHSVKAWRPTIGGARLSSPAVGRAGDRAAVFFGHWVWDKSLAGHLQAGGLSAVDASSGRAIWTTALGDNQLSSPVYALLGGARRLFVASENGNLYALDADRGEVLWSFTERNAIKASPTLFVGPRGARVAIGSKAGRVRCLDAGTGHEIWSFKTSHWVDSSAAVGEVKGRTLLFVGSYDTNLYALDAESGVMQWSYRTRGGIYSSPAFFHDERGRPRVVVASWDHHLHCVDAVEGRPLWKVATGSPIWDSITLGDSIWSSPSVLELESKTPLIVFGSYAGPLHAIPFAEARRQDVLAGPGSNRDFWIRLPAVMLAVAVLTLVLTRRHKRARAASAPQTR